MADAGVELKNKKNKKMGFILKEIISSERVFLNNMRMLGRLAELYEQDGTEFEPNQEAVVHFFNLAKQISETSFVFITELEKLEQLDFNEALSYTRLKIVLRNLQNKKMEQNLQNISAANKVYTEADLANVLSEKGLKKSVFEEIKNLFASWGQPQNIASVAITVAQRMPRYILLGRELLKTLKEREPVDFVLNERVEDVFEHKPNVKIKIPDLEASLEALKNLKGKSLLAFVRLNQQDKEDSMILTTALKELNKAIERNYLHLANRALLSEGFACLSQQIKLEPSLEMAVQKILADKLVLPKCAVPSKAPSMKEQASNLEALSLDKQKLNPVITYGLNATADAPKNNAEAYHDALVLLVRKAFDTHFKSDLTKKKKLVITISKEIEQMPEQCEKLIDLIKQEAKKRIQTKELVPLNLMVRKAATLQVVDLGLSVWQRNR